MNSSFKKLFKLSQKSFKRLKRKEEKLNGKLKNVLENRDKILKVAEKESYERFEVLPNKEEKVKFLIENYKNNFWIKDQFVRNLFYLLNSKTEDKKYFEIKRKITNSLDEEILRKLWEETHTNYLISGNEIHNKELKEKWLKNVEVYNKVYKKYNNVHLRKFFIETLHDKIKNIKTEGEKDLTKITNKNKGEISELLRVKYKDKMFLVSRTLFLDQPSVSKELKPKTKGLASEFEYGVKHRIEKLKESEKNCEIIKSFVVSIKKKKYVLVFVKYKSDVLPLFFNLFDIYTMNSLKNSKVFINLRINSMEGIIVIKREGKKIGFVVNTFSL